jgi:hypothetical protein
MLKIPDATKSIPKGFPLKMIFDKGAVNQLLEELSHYVETFNPHWRKLNAQ